ncbi:MAG: B12-binding domain-containing radical SAM protein [Candidatus Omnitrophica bacterium]|nr:B12-binding domain-containing radical SAM protein [Candidatus Omnitrophota bacterium]
MKILFMYPNAYLSNGVPTGIATLSSLLKERGHEVDVFDWTFIKTAVRDTTPTYGTRILLPTRYTLEDLTADDPVFSLEDAFAEKLQRFRPDLVAVSVLTGYFDAVIDLLKKVKPSCRVVAGGIHPTICPEDALSFREIDMICVGEGEEFMVELCEAMEKGKDITGIRNLGYKTERGTRFNELRPFVNLDNLPDMDWGIFDKRHLFRPFQGTVYSGGCFLMSRGCPERCTYCLNWAFRDKFRGCGRYFRFQSPQTTGRQIRFLKERYNADFFRFYDESLALFDEKFLTSLVGELKPLGIKFACSLRPETISKRKVDLLVSMGCVAANIGLESGNERIRAEILNRRMSNDQIRHAVDILKGANIRVTTFNMIGLPGETRENVFETIELNKSLDIPAVNVYAIYPYPGTEIYNRFHPRLRDESGMITPVSRASSFGMSKMTSGEIDGLLRTFEFYVRLPEDIWPQIQIAEGNDICAEDARKQFQERLTGLSSRSASCC